MPSRLPALVLLLAAAAPLSVALPVPANGSATFTSLDGGWAPVPGLSATVLTGVSFYTEQQGIVIGGTNGVGPSVSATTNSGESFAPAAFEDMPFFLINGALFRDSSVVSGMGAWAWHSADSAQTFRVASAPLPINPGPQYVDAMLYDGQVTFVITGESLAYNGVSVSYNGGATFEPGVDVFAERTIGSALWPRQFAASADSMTWFVSGGSSSSASTANDDDYVHFTDQIHLRRDALKSLNRTSNTNSPPILLLTPPEAQRSRAAGIAKSGDGGRTWRIVYEAEGDISFSGISCWDAERCITVATSSSGSQVMSTVDGGFSWQLSLAYPAGMEGSLMPVQCLANGEAWAAGGGPDPANPFALESHFWHTADFGENWKLHTLPGGIVFDLSFPPGQSDVGYAVQLGLVQSGLVKFTRTTNK